MAVGESWLLSGVCAGMWSVGWLAQVLEHGVRVAMVEASRAQYLDKRPATQQVETGRERRD